MKHGTRHARSGMLWYSIDMMRWATRRAPLVVATILLIVCVGGTSARAQHNVEPATTQPDSPRTNDPADAIRVMSPERDWEWLKTIDARWSLTSFATISRMSLVCKRS